MITAKLVITKPVIRIDNNFAYTRNASGGYDRYNLNWYRIGSDGACQ